jgi:hypothetical protein
MDCVSGLCTNGICVNANQCMTSMDCTNPPPASCFMMGTMGFYTYYTPACVGGMCGYNQTTVSCPHGCAGNACAM